MLGGLRMEACRLQPLFSAPALTAYDLDLDILPQKIKVAVEDAGEQVAGRTLLDLISTDAGLKAWTTVGDSVNKILDLTPGSKSWRKLRTGERKKRPCKHQQSMKNPT